MRNENSGISQLYRGYIGVILGLYWENGKENGNYYKIGSIFRDNGKEHGNSCSTFGLGCVLGMVVGITMGSDSE